MNHPEFQIIAILTVAAFVRGAFGFADALLAMPLLLLLIPNTEAAPLMAIVACLLAIIILYRERQAVEFRSAALLIVFGLVGVPFGVWLATIVNQQIARAALGLVVMAFAAWSLWKPGQLQLKTNRAAPVFGLAAGILGGAFNTSGPPMVFFAALRGWPPQQFRATMQTYAIFGSSWVIVMHAMAGNLTSVTLNRFAFAVPFVVIATLIGQQFTARLATDRFIRWIYWLLILLGIGLCTTALLPAKL